MAAGIPVAVAEQSEAGALYDGMAAIPASARAALGLETARVAGGVILAMRNDPSGFWSKALGFGFTEPVTAELVAHVCDFYRSRGLEKAVIQLAPAVIPGDWLGICAKLKLSPGPVQVKAVRAVDPAVTLGLGGAGLHTGPVPAAQVANWASVMRRGSGMPGEALYQLAAATFGRPGWYPFAAWDGEDLVATATMYVRSGAAQFFGAATLPPARRRGAQSALLAARARAAQAMGCRWLIAETGAETPGRHNSSLHNLLRAGFTAVYHRQDWVWQATATAGR